MERKIYIKAIFSVGAGLLLSQCAQFARDVIMSRKYGISLETDAYFAAFSLPFFYYSVLLLCTARVVIPILSRERHENKAPDYRIVNNLVWFFLLLAFLLVTPATLFPSIALDFFTPGIDGSVKALAEKNLSILIWLVIPSTLIAFHASILRSYKYYFIPSFLRFVGNISYILVIVLMPINTKTLIIASFGFFISQFVYLAINVRRTGYTFTRPHFSDTGKSLLHLSFFIYPILAISMNQLTIISERFFSSLLSVGNISLIAYSSRIYTGIANLIGGTFMAAALPTFSDMISRQQSEALLDNIKYNLKLIIYISIPISVLLVFLSDSVSLIIWGGGAIRETEVAQISSIIKVYSIGLLFGASVPLLTTVFSAFLDFKAVFLVASLFISSNILVNALLLSSFGMYSIPIAKGAANFCALFFSIALLKKRGMLLLRANTSYCIKILVLTTVLLCYVALADRFFSWVAFEKTKIVSVLYVTFIGSTALIVYFTTSIYLKMDELTTFIQLLKNKIKGKKTTPDNS